jgi:hypothetical protein
MQVAQAGDTHLDYSNAHSEDVHSEDVHLEDVHLQDAGPEETTAMQRLAECAVALAEPAVALHWLHKIYEQSKRFFCLTFQQTKEVRALTADAEEACWAAERVLWIGSRGGRFGGISPHAIRLASVYAGFRSLNWQAP